MANKTADSIIYTKLPRAGRRPYVIADGVSLFVQSLVGLNAAGYLDKWADTAGMQFQGVVLDGDRRGGPHVLPDGTFSPIIGETSDPRPPEAYVDCKGDTFVSVPVASLVQASVNSLVYCATDNLADCTLSAGSNVKAIGWVSRFTSAGVGDVTLFTPEEHQALN